MPRMKNKLFSKVFCLSQGKARWLVISNCYPQKCCERTGGVLCCGALCLAEPASQSCCDVSHAQLIAARQFDWTLLLLHSPAPWFGEQEGAALVR